MPMSQADFQQFFLEKRNGTYKCPFCGREEFTVNVASIGASPTETIMAELLIRSEAEELPDMGAVACYSFSCVNGGHTDFFHRNQIDA